MAQGDPCSLGSLRRLGVDARQADRVSELAAARGLTPGQLALAWVMAKGEDIVPIPGTKRAYLEENAGAAEPELSASEVATLDHR